MPLTGAYYYKKPNKHKLVLNKNTLKNLFAKYPNIFGWDPPKAEDFNATVKSGQMLDGRRCFYLVLIPKQGMGDLLKEELWVDEEYYTLPQHKYYYKNNGFIHVRAQYMNSGGYMVFKSMSASVSFPKVNINTSVSATYSDYQFNLGLTDEFFQIPKR